MEGITFYATDEIYLRRCPTRAGGEQTLVFAHELIHVEHPGWPHWKVYRLDDWYARVVVGPKLRAAGERFLPPTPKAAS